MLLCDIARQERSAAPLSRLLLRRDVALAGKGTGVVGDGPACLTGPLPGAETSASPHFLLLLLFEFVSDMLYLLVNRGLTRHLLRECRLCSIFVPSCQC